MWRATFKHVRYLLRHKWFVLLGCWYWNVPNWLWVGLIHDWTKFLPSEWGPYTRFFYTPDGTLKYTGDSYSGGASEEFDRAWNLHQKRNPHHWQFWVMERDSGKVVVLEMPRRYLLEMLADWMGAARAQGRAFSASQVRKWYGKHAGEIMLHPATRATLNMLLMRSARTDLDWMRGVISLEPAA